MLNRILEIYDENRYISLNRGFIIIKSENKILGKVPLTDISVLLLTAQRITVSKNILIALSEQGCITVLCGKNYMPQGMVIPFANHCLFTKIVNEQIKISEPFKKKIWQQIVVKKIKNQSIVLKLCNKEYKDLNQIALNVKSGDTSNREAYAAKKYWHLLFGDNFRRDRNQIGVNSLLNYGYAIIRASMARAICSSGLLPSLGINHRNNLNQFCLVDDFMEIYRPFIDLYVYNLWLSNNLELTSDVKKEIVELLWTKVKTENGISPIFQSMYYMATSYVNAFESKKAFIDLPDWEVNN